MSFDLHIKQKQARPLRSFNSFLFSRVFPQVGCFFVVDDGVLFFS